MRYVFDFGKRQLEIDASQVISRGGSALDPIKLAIKDGKGWLLTKTAFGEDRWINLNKCISVTEKK